MTSILYIFTQVSLAGFGKDAENMKSLDLSKSARQGTKWMKLVATLKCAPSTS